MHSFKMYMWCTFLFYLFTIEFIGYSDEETNTPDGIGVPVQIEPATRYFPIGFNKVNITFIFRFIILNIFHAELFGHIIFPFQQRILINMQAS